MNQGHPGQNPTFGQISAGQLATLPQYGDPATLVAQRKEAAEKGVTGLKVPLPGHPFCPGLPTQKAVTVAPGTVKWLSQGHMASTVFVPTVLWGRDHEQLAFLGGEQMWGSPAGSLFSFLTQLCCRPSLPHFT